MLMQYGLDVNELIQTAFDSFPQGLLNEKTPSETADFMQARLAVLLQNDYPQDIVAAVLAKQPRRLDDLTAKLQAVAVFKQLPEAAALAAANKRVQNLLKKPMPSWARLTKACCNRTKKKPCTLPRKVCSRKSPPPSPKAISKLLCPNWLPSSRRLMPSSTA